MPLSVRFAGLRRKVRAFVAHHGVFATASIALLHLAAAAIMFWYEVTLYSMTVFVLTWGLLNYFWLLVLRRAAIAATLSLVTIGLLITLSELKYAALWLQLSFIDLMIIDTDTAEYVLTIFPWLGWTFVAVAAVVLPLLVLICWVDPIQVRMRTALAGFAVSLVGIFALCSAFELNPLEGYHGNKYISFFTRSAVVSLSELMTHGMFESDAVVADRLKPVADSACRPAGKPPHIILVHDESSFDIRSAPGLNLPPKYGEHFKSFDGKERKFLVEGVGGPSWYAEYSVLTGLSPRSFGRFSYFVTRLASGRVLRGLPNMLRRCGYQTRTIYSALGAFMSERSFHTNVGVQKFRDQNDLRADEFEPDAFYYDKALAALARERNQRPMFLYVYLAANHYPWYERWRSDLMPQWQDLQNPSVVDEYLRRQTISAQDFAAFKADLARKFPEESFLLVRYGDHQPDFSTSILEPWLKPAEIALRVRRFDPKYFTTYYAIDAINFKPVDMSSAADTLDGPYLPLVIQEAAGLPLDPSFAEQKNILRRCAGIFYACNGGAEARRFNRLLIDAGLIKQL
jgi:phosphoglycerol transferase MdoB-like AlkP superfamily enzyme